MNRLALRLAGPASGAQAVVQSATRRVVAEQPAA
jgi:hypothetical protein